MSWEILLASLMNTSTSEEVEELLEGQDEVTRKQVIANIESMSQRAINEGKSSTVEFLQGILKVLRKSLPVFAVVFALSMFFFHGVSTVMAENAKQSVSAEVIEHLNQDKFEAVHSTAEFPEQIKTSFQKSTGQSDLKKIIADPNQEFNSSCVQKPGGAPTKQLLLAAKSKDLFLWYYELGGFALVDTIELYKLDAHECARVWSNSMIAEHPKTVEQLLKVTRERVK